MLLINITSSGHSQLNMWQLSRTAEGWKKCDISKNSTAYTCLDQCGSMRVNIQHQLNGRFNCNLQIIHIKTPSEHGNVTKAIIKHFRLKLNVYIKIFQCEDHLIHRKMLTNSFYFKNNMQVSEQKKIIVFGDLQISLDCLVSENVIRWMPQGVIDNKLTLVQVMAWCSQASTGLIVLSCCSDSGIVTNVSSYHNNVSAE